MEFTRDRLMRAGIELRRLMASEGMQDAIALLQEDYRFRIVSTGMTETGLREELYHQYSALGELIGVITTLTQQAEDDFLRHQQPETE